MAVMYKRGFTRPYVLSEHTLVIEEAYLLFVFIPWLS